MFCQNFNVLYCSFRHVFYFTLVKRFNDITKHIRLDIVMVTIKTQVLTTKRFSAAKLITLTQVFKTKCSSFTLLPILLKKNWDTLNFCCECTEV